MSDRRAAIVAEARSWIGTPYVRAGRLKGVGCDCGTLLVEVLRATAVLSEEDVAALSLGSLRGDWWNHATDERYLLRVMRYGRKILEGSCLRVFPREISAAPPAPGSIVVTKIQNTQRFNHGAIVTAWPYGVHAVAPAVRETDLSGDPMWSFRPIEIFDPFQATT